MYMYMHLIENYTVIDIIDNWFKHQKMIILHKFLQTYECILHTVNERDGD